MTPLSVEAQGAVKTSLLSGISSAVSGLISLLTIVEKYDSFFLPAADRPLVTEAVSILTDLQSVLAKL